MTNQRKIFGALLTLAASAFGVDHWWLGSGAAQAEAPANVQTAHASAPRRIGPSPKPAKAIPAHRTLASRLLDAARAEQVSPGEDEEAAAVPDAFRPASLWYPAATPLAAAPAAPAIAPEKIAEFRSRHRLTAVMKSSRPGETGGTGGMAIIGGKVYVPGQVIDGFTLVSLGDRTAQLRCRGVCVELAIDPPGA